MDLLAPLISIFAFSTVWFLIIVYFYPISYDNVLTITSLVIIGGILSIYIVGYTNNWIDDYIDPSGRADLYNKPIVAYFKYFFSAMNEEFWKLVACLLFTYKKRIKKPIDGIVFGMMVGLGFSVYENIYYVKSFPEIFLFRVFICTAGHICYSGIWGHGLAKTKFRKNNCSFLQEFSPYFLLGVSFHFIYNYFLGAYSNIFFYFVVTMQVVLLFFCFRLLRRLSVTTV